MKNILLTGSSGFIGDYFIKKYQNKYIIKKFSFRNDDFKKLDLKDVSTIIHLSALVHQMGKTSKDEYFKVNVTQTINLAIKAKSSGVKHFVFMSTVKVYGEETDIAYTEMSKCNPQDDYAKSKLKAECELQKLEDSNFRISIIRTPIVYGYGVKANIKNLVSLIKKVPILPFGYINNKRSMVYVGNLCHLIDIIITQQKQGIFLASDDNTLSTTSLIVLISKYLNKKIYLIKIPFFESLLKIVKPSFHKRLYESLEVNNSKTKKILKLENKYSAEDGIEIMLNGEL